MERLKRVLDNILDDKLILKVYKIREKGRNEYLVVAMWNSFMVSFVF